MILYPRIHNNGSDGNKLFDDVSLAINYMRQSIVGLRNTEPHARDYYIIGDNAYVKARNEYVERLDKVTQVLKELEYIQESISDQIDARTAKKF